MNSSQQTKSFVSAEQTKKIIGKTYYELTFDAIRLVGAGNAAGLLASASAIGNASEKHLPLFGLKCSALCFALGVVGFSFAYFFLYGAVVAIDTAYRNFEDKAAGRSASQGTSNEDLDTGKGGHLAGYMALGSAVLFLAGLAISVCILLNL
jgi:hypothetical protein